MFNFKNRDEFLSEEDLDVGNLPWPERIIAWNAWLRNMQSTNDEDEDDYSHGVFRSDKQKREIWGENWREVIKEAASNNEKDAE